MNIVSRLAHKCPVKKHLIDHARPMFSSMNRASFLNQDVIAIRDYRIMEVESIISLNEFLIRTVEVARIENSSTLSILYQRFIQVSRWHSCRCTRYRSALVFKKRGLHNLATNLNLGYYLLQFRLYNDQLASMRKRFHGARWINNADFILNSRMGHEWWRFLSISGMKSDRRAVGGDFIIAKKP